MAICAYANVSFASTWAGKIVPKKWKFLQQISIHSGDIKVC